MHLYNNQGKPVYEVPYANGKGTRDATLADARKLKLVPSVTELLKVKSSGALGNWLVEQGILAALENPLKSGEDIKEYVSRITNLSREKTQKAAKRGNEIHGKLEEFFLDGKIDDIDRDILKPALDAVDTLKYVHEWTSEASFAHKEGFGGKVDLHAKDVVLDFKTKSKDTVDEKSCYFDYCMQLAAYREGLSMPTAKCYNLLISTTKPGIVYLHEWAEEDLSRGWKMFQHLLEYWKLDKKYDSSFGGIKE